MESADLDCLNTFYVSITIISSTVYNYSQKYKDHTRNIFYTLNRLRTLKFKVRIHNSNAHYLI